jgi:hypothetical protein
VVYGGKHGGEIAAALGALVGGVVGAGGAVLAVFLTLSRQREEDTAKVATAVRTEVATYVKYVIGSIEICQQIQGGLKMPRQDASAIVQNLIADPVVYPAVADRIGLLPHPNMTAEFYMRIAEAKSMVEILRTKTNPQGATYVTPPVELVSAEFAALLAESLITALQLARPIVAETGNQDAERLAAQIHTTVVGRIDECLASAKTPFPDAESFKAAGA